MIFIVIVTCYLLFIFSLIYLLRAHKILLTVAILSIAILGKAFIVQAYKIPAGSMMPTLLIGDKILTNKYVYRLKQPQRGDLVIFPYPESPNKDFIKRVVGVGGDVIEMKEKSVYLNGNLISEPYVANLDVRTMDKRDSFGPIQIPSDSIFVLGDNRDNSYDSRFWGFVKTTSVKAKAERIYWSKDKETLKIRWDRIGNKIK